jgi:hypothetical protein
VGTTVVGRGDGTEPFLASSVPLEEKDGRLARVHRAQDSQVLQ